MSEKRSHKRQSHTSAENGKKNIEPVCEFNVITYALRHLLNIHMHISSGRLEFAHFLQLAVISFAHFSRFQLPTIFTTQI